MPSKETQLAEIVVLGDDHETIPGGVILDCRIRLAMQANVIKMS